MLEKHPTVQLQDFIKKIVETKSKNEEDILVKKNLEFLKGEISKKNINNAKMIEYIIRGVYSEMMGHHAEFMHFQAINLLTNKSILMKKIGYLASSLFLEENADLKILIVAPIQKDLQSKEDIVVLMALTCLMKLITPSLAETFPPFLLKLAKNKNILIKKKAINCIFRIEQISPGTFNNYFDLINEWLLDQNICIINAVLNIIFEESKKNCEKLIILYKPICTIFEQILKNIGKFLTYDNIPEPWIQVKILQIFDLFLNQDKSISKYIYNYIIKCLKKNNNLLCDVSFMILYQVLLTLSNFKIEIQDIEVVNEIVHKFLTKKYDNPNLLYLGLKALKKLIKLNFECLQSHQSFIIECLESRDESIKRITLELLFLNANKNNIKLILDKLVNNLEATNDVYFKKKINKYIFDLVEKLSPSIEYFVETVINLLEITPDLISDKKITKIINILNENIEFDENFANFLIEKFLKIFGEQKIINDKIVKIGIFILTNHDIVILQYDKDYLTIILDIIKKLIYLNILENDTKLWIIQNIDKFSEKLEKEKIYCENLINYVKSLPDNELNFRLNLLIKNKIKYESNQQEINYDFKFCFDYYSDPNLKNYDKNKANKIFDENLINNGKNEIKFYHKETDNTKNLNDNFIKNKNNVWTKKGYAKTNDNENFKEINFIENMKKMKQNINEKMNENPLNQKNQIIANTLFQEEEVKNINFTKKQKQNKNEDLGEINILEDIGNNVNVNVNNEFKLEPSNFDPQEYWEQIEHEYSGNLVIKLNNNEFEELYKKKGFCKISQIENEYIFGATLNNKKIILYIPFEKNSEIEYILKCENSKDKNFIENLIN